MQCVRCTKSYLHDNMKRIRVGILGATGLVGQTLVKLLEGHEWFEVSELAASERSVGRTYSEVMKGRWSISEKIPEYAQSMEVKECRPGLDCSLLFSALDSGVAGPIEEAFAGEGYAVSSNARNHRMEPDVPLLIPEVNAGHVSLIERQRKERKWDGFIVTNPNCSTIHLALALKPIYDAFGIEKVMVTTLQALSGAGYPGVPSLDSLDNVIPFIASEEEKLHSEPLKILGKLEGSSVSAAGFSISAQCNRVSVKYGHTECVSVKLARKPDVEELIAVLEAFNPLKGMGLPTAPAHPLIVMHEEARPQPRFDLHLEAGMASIIGRIRSCNILDYKFVVLGHNIIRGAAGGALLNAELLKAKGYI